jgi:hypothetical protein
LSDLTELYLLFLVLYLFESIAWVPRRAVGFFRFLGRWRARAAFRPNPSWKVSAIFGKPWPPLSPPWLAEPLPVAVDPDGITRIEAEGQHTEWAALGPVTARGERLESRDAPLATLATRSGAAALAAALERARVASVKQREGMLRELIARRFDMAEATARRQRFQTSVRLLPVASNALWLCLFGGLGVAAFTGHLQILIAAAAMSILLWPLNALAFWWTLRKLDWLDRAQRPAAAKRWVAYLSPLSGLRAADLLAREVFGDLDPMAVAASLLSAEDLAGFARPRLVAMQPRPGAPLAWWREQNRVQIERVLRDRRIDIEQLLAAPRRDGPHVETYCPSCLAQYESGHQAGEPCPCDTCPDIPLRAFADVQPPP